MKILISPAKKMRIDTDDFAPKDLPVFLDRAEKLRSYLQGLSFEELRRLLACNEKIAGENSLRLQDMDLRANLTPAILSYDGIQYTYMAPRVFTDEALAYTQEHLRILSGFHGVLRPLDGVAPYRLEMQAKVKIEGYRDLYDFWGDAICREVRDPDRIIVNLASREYASVIEPYLTPQDIYITCIFGELVNGHIVQKGVRAKMARGDMVSFLAKKRPEVRRPEDLSDLMDSLRAFEVGGYRYREEYSTDRALVFLKEAQEGAGV